MSKKLFETLLAELKRAKQSVKLKKANKAGFEEVWEYENYLRGELGMDLIEAPKEAENVFKGKIHYVTILDATGSMDCWGNQDSKYDASKQGILQELEMLRNEKDVNITYSLIEFVHRTNIRTHFFLSDILPHKDNIQFVGPVGNNTPLYKTVYDVLNSLLNKNLKNDKILVKIYTDGGENCFNLSNKSCSKKIKEAQENNITVTFVGTNKDMEVIILDLDLDSSNTLSIENTAEGFKEAFATASLATSNYTKNVKAGKDVSRGFYKNIN